jgi:anti-sigma regulatory factor (Ser/Thr protein kinase)
MRPKSPLNALGGIERARRFEPEPLNVRAARDFVAGALEAQGFHGDADVVLLLASELVTNAVRHARTPFDVTVDVQDEKVKVAVIDGDRDHQPQMQNPGPDATNGRGLRLVDELATYWGSDRTGRGKAVWFTVP